MDNLCSQENCDKNKIAWESTDAIVNKILTL